MQPRVVVGHLQAEVPRRDALAVGDVGRGALAEQELDDAPEQGDGEVPSNLESRSDPEGLQLADPVPEEPEPEEELTGHRLLEREVTKARATVAQLLAAREHCAKTKNYRELGQVKQDLAQEEVELALKEDEYAAALAEWEAQEQERKEQRRQASLTSALAQVVEDQDLEEYAVRP